MAKEAQESSGDRKLEGQELLDVTRRAYLIAAEVYMLEGPNKFPFNEFLYVEEGAAMFRHRLLDGDFVIGGIIIPGEENPIIGYGDASSGLPEKLMTNTSDIASIVISSIEYFGSKKSQTE